MNKPQLTVEHLLRSGFLEVGCWQLNRGRELSHQIDLPAAAGVYAFAIEGVVQYVGVSAKSLRQRFRFYAKPGKTQTTSIRLNELIRGRIAGGATVEVLIANPPDHEWNGLKISGSEGLEAGLICDFDLPWNKRGSPTIVQSEPAKAGRNTKSASVVDIVRRRPGMTELEIAKAIYGPRAVQQQVNAECRRLVNLGLVERRGLGGAGDPFTYRSRKKEDPRSSPG